jgi:hypothetical protein
MKVNYTPRARGDIDVILSYIDQRNRRALVTSPAPCTGPLS